MRLLHKYEIAIVKRCQVARNFANVSFSHYCLLFSRFGVVLRRSSNDFEVLHRIENSDTRGWGNKTMRTMMGSKRMTTRTTARRAIAITLQYHERHTRTHDRYGVYQHRARQSTFRLHLRWSTHYCIRLLSIIISTYFAEASLSRKNEVEREKESESESEKLHSDRCRWPTLDHFINNRHAISFALHDNDHEHIDRYIENSKPLEYHHSLWF